MKRLTKRILSPSMPLNLASPALAACLPPGSALDAWFIKEKGVWRQFALNGPTPLRFNC